PGPRARIIGHKIEVLYDHLPGRDQDGGGLHSHAGAKDFHRRGARGNIAEAVFSSRLGERLEAGAVAGVPAEVEKLAGGGVEGATSSGARGATWGQAARRPERDAQGESQTTGPGEEEHRRGVLGRRNFFAPGRHYAPWPWRDNLR